MRRGSLSPRNTRSTGAPTFSLSDLLAIFPNLLPLLPNDQIDNEVQAAEITSLGNFDFRIKGSKKMDPYNRDAKPTTLSVYGKKFTDLYRLGTFVYSVKDPVAGLSHFGDLLFVMMNPVRLFEGQNSHPESPRGNDDINSVNQRALGKANRLLEIGGLEYMRACFEHAIAEANGALPALIVLGEQLKERDVNLEPYQCRNFISCSSQKNNVHRYSTTQTAAASKITADIDIYHINMKAFENAQIDSSDIEKLFKIYTHSLAINRPLIIHCTDGLDRSGGLALAFQLFHHWGRVFTGLNEAEIVENIVREHQAMQQQRGPSFCTAVTKRIHGAVLLAGIMKAFQKAQELIERIERFPQALRKTDYLQQIFYLEEIVDPTLAELLNILKLRQTLEKLYFESFAEEIDHPQIDLYSVGNILNDELLTVEDSIKGELYQRYLYLKLNYINKGFESEELTSLQYLKCEVETYSITRKINHDLDSLDEDEYKDDLKAKFEKVELITNDKPLKLKRLKVLNFEIQAIKLYSQIESMFSEFPDTSIDSYVQEFFSRKKTLTQHFKGAHIVEPNLKKTESLISGLNDLLKTLIDIKTRANEQLEQSPRKNRAGSFRLQLSPRGSRNFVGDEGANEQTSTSPRSLFHGLMKSPKGSRRGSRAITEPNNDETPASETASEAGPPLTHSGSLSKSVGRLFKQLSPRGSRRGSVLVKESESEQDTSASPDGIPSQELNRALGKLAQEQQASPRGSRKFSLSPRAGRKHAPPAEQDKRKSLADDELETELLNNLNDLGI